MKKLSLTLLLVMLISGLPLTYAKPPAVNLDQVRNGPASSPYNPIQWHNGNLNPQHSHYVEGYSVPYRAIMTDLPTDGTVITLTIGYDIKDQGKHAIDYLTHYDYIDDPSHSTTFGHSQETIVPLLGVAGVSGTISTYAIPAPSSTGSPVTNQPTNSFTNLPAGKNLMTLFGGTISNVVYSDEGDLTAAHDEARVSITFTVDSSTAVLAWGGHIASRIDWGFDGGEARSAGEINGSPYHMRIIDWNLGNLGNQDRSLKIFDPTGTIIVEKKIDLGQSSEYMNDIVFEFTGDVQGFIGDGEQIIKSDMEPGTYYVTENNMGWTTSIEIIDPDNGSSYNGVTTTIDLDAGETVKVIYTNRPPDFVIPETPLGTIFSLITMLGAFLLLRSKNTLNLAK